MPQTPEAQAFLSRIAQLPPGPGATDALSLALQPSLDDEAELRKLFATDKTANRLNDNHVGLVDVFDAPDDIRKTRARIVADEADLSAKHIMPLPEGRRREEGAPCIVSSLDEFKKNWAIFTEGSVSQLVDWSNVMAAGGAVQACLTPLPEYAKASKRTMRKYFHNRAFPTSDVDLFLYGLTPEEAEAKMHTIYEAVRDSVPWDVTCVRAIVLRLYRSPAEILAGFDVDAPCCAYDGERVWANPRAIVAMMRQCNTVDMTRRPPRTKRDDIDPTIFERSIARVQGLARLLVLEKLMDADTRYRYLTDRRSLRARPDVEGGWARRFGKKLKGDLKANMDLGGLEMNDYDVVSLHIPYGPGWDARRIEKLVYQTDLGMNSPFNPKNKDRKLHRHPAFFGTIDECLSDCCEYCVAPATDEEKKLQEAEDNSYIRGRVEFVQEDPGRQSTSGSFKPVDVGEWAEQAYIGPTEKLFNAIVSEDRSTVSRIIQEKGTDLQRRDHVGRTPLQIAILSKAEEIACDLVDAGARLTSRLVDGRTALHLAAELDLPAVVRKLLERSAINAEKAKEEEETTAKHAKEKVADAKMDVDEGEAHHNDGEGNEENSSEDDWSTGEDDGEKRPKKTEEKPPVADDSQIPEDEKDVLDVLDVNAPDWDLAFTPLQYAVVFGSTAVTGELLAAGADPKLVTKANGRMTEYQHPLTLTVLTTDDDAACKVAKKLLAGGAISSEADEDLLTIFHRIACAGKAKLLSTILSSDPNAKAVINTPYVHQNFMMTFPVVSAIVVGSHSALAVLLAFGGKLIATEEDINKAQDQRKSQRNRLKWQTCAVSAIETAIAKHDDVAELLVALGADINIGTKKAYLSNDKRHHRSLVEWVRCQLQEVAKQLNELSEEEQEEKDPKLRAMSSTPGWKGDLARHILKVRTVHTVTGRYSDESKKEAMLKSKEYLTKIEALLTANGAKTWDELYPEDKADPNTFPFGGIHNYKRPETEYTYYRFSGMYASFQASGHLIEQYDELFDACAAGDNARIEKLCLSKDGEALQIAVEFGSNTGCTPLFLALQYRHWDTARLILAIANAQYKSEESKVEKFETKNLTLVVHEPELMDDDDDADMEIDETPITPMDFTDIAKRSSGVATTTPPSKMLQHSNATYLGEDGESKFVGPVLLKAIIDDDLEAFVQIADMHRTLPTPLPLSAQTLQLIIEHDRPAMLDELIRCTGLGISLPSEVEDEQDDVKQKRLLSSKVYLGLNVHGKKRKDLIKKIDPNAPQEDNSYIPPIVWQAAKEGALDVVQYLATDRPLAAYQYYASTQSDERAQQLRRVSNLAGQLPAWLGWSLGPLNESVYTAAVIGDKLSVLEAVAALQVPAIKNALTARHIRINYVGFNHILAAANWGCSPALFDYLLAKGVSPIEVDHRGWNIYHLLCAWTSSQHATLFKHVLHKLPQDVTERLLLQQSKTALNTPLHILVKRKKVDQIRRLLDAKVSSFLLRDVNGSTALHIAVKQGSAEIVRLIGNAGPDEALHMEDAVGNTPLEIAVSRDLQYKTTHKTIRGFPANMTLKQEAEVQKFRTTVADLLSEGRLRSGTKLATELLAFADKMETALVDAKAAEEAKASMAAAEAQAKGENITEIEDTNSPSKTLAYLQDIVRARPGGRRLVHLIDVHRSVTNSLDRSRHVAHTFTPEMDDGLAVEVEENKEELEKSRNILSIWSEWPRISPFNNDDV
ncbi:hypothetical protein A0H81_06697 [Grifola frondosa]|uniref:Ankyrin repeat protein n=1 Tax=Grifola frondosa TaxID=5627 RepID=A0A1C7M888_GRIFR|nr:hypothetical protein A0H81_06697 [Grifola frondosa]